jgi:hypothetical protein
MAQMRIGLIKSKAEDYAIAASIHSGKRIHANDFLPRQLRELPPPPDEREMEARSKRLGITKTEAY